MKFKNLVAASAALTGAVAGVSYLVFYEVMNRNAKLPQKLGSVMAPPSEDVVPADEDPRKLWLDEQEFEQFSIKNAEGNTLYGYLLRPETPSDIYVFCSHGYRSSGKGQFALIVKYYHDQGYNVFLVDHRGAGTSEGKYIGFGVHEHKDSLLWLDFMNETFGPDIQIILHGISLGCATVTMMSGCPELPANVKFIIADCGFTSAQAEFEHNLKNLHVPKYPLLPVTDFANKLFSGFNFKEADPINYVKNAKVPMLFIHGTKDDFVPTFMVHQLYGACGSEYKDLLLVEGAAHAESYAKDSAAYEAKIQEFVDRFIDKPADKSADPA
ncbi:MAG: alpha/beta hydrolase [Clostridia bacterium]|nr:alpha/beta hydrolase [Clostridia bacterium]